MTMSVNPVGGAPFLPSLPALADTGGATGAGASTGAGPSGFAGMISNALDSVQAAQQNADGLAAKAATGNVADIQDYLIATTQATVDTQITAAVRDKAIQAFQSIMGMPV
jgi:flagellar hook-basal body complex protein FliE